MRYRDAAHVDLGSFYSRLPERGAYFRLLGYGAIALAVVYRGDERAIAALLVCLILAWLRAWQVVVGAAWRSSIVAAVVLCAVLLTHHRLAAAATPAASAPAAVQVTP